MLRQLHFVFLGLCRIYNFFAVSMHRWKLLMNSLGQNSVVLKTLSNTRWSTRCNAVRAVKTSYRQINSTLQNISNDNNDTGQTCFEASSLATQMTKLEFAVLCILWDRVLWQFNVASKALYKETRDTSTVMRLYTGFENFVNSLWDDYDSCEKEAEMLTDNLMHNDKPKRKRFLQEGIENEDDKDISLLVTSFELIPLQLFEIHWVLNLNAESKPMQGIMKGFKLFSICVGSPLTWSIVLLRIFKMPTLQIRKILLMKWFVSLDTWTKWMKTFPR